MFSKDEGTRLARRPLARQARPMLLQNARSANDGWPGTQVGPVRHEQAHLSLWDAEGVCLATMVMTGTVSSLTLDLRAMLWLMTRTCAAGALLSHVHPSGDPTPSRNDVEVTRRLWRAARLVGVRLHDHVIHGDSTRFSFRDAGLL